MPSANCRHGGDIFEKQACPFPLPLGEAESARRRCRIRQRIKVKGIRVLSKQPVKQFIPRIIPLSEYDVQRVKLASLLSWVGRGGPPRRSNCRATGPVAIPRRRVGITQSVTLSLSKGLCLTTLQAMAKKPTSPSPKVAYWLTTIASDDGTGEEWLEEALGKYHYYAFGKGNPKQVELKRGDRICFYAAPRGVVADATVLHRPEDRKRPDGDRYKEYPWVCLLKNVNLYLNKPVVIDPTMRWRLDEFKGRDHRKNWGWFVQRTRELSPRDFAHLARRRGE
jgi:hypothetical protein